MRKVSVAWADALLLVSESVRVEVCFSFYLDFSPFLFVSPSTLVLKRRRKAEEGISFTARVMLSWGLLWLLLLLLFSSLTYLSSLRDFQFDR
jgi:hypothetical protein